MKINIYSDYEDLYLPEHESKSIGRINDDPWAEYDRSSMKKGELRKEIERFIEKRIGRQFNDVFSEFCRKYPEEKFGYNTRTLFKDDFTIGTYRDKYRPFYVENDGTVQEHITPKYKRNNYLLKPFHLWKKIHIPNKEMLNFYYADLCDIVGGSLMWEVMNNYSEDVYKKFYKKCYDGKYYIRLVDMYKNNPFQQRLFKYVPITGDRILNYLFDWQYVDKYFESRDELIRYKKSHQKMSPRKKRKLSKRRHEDYWGPWSEYRIYEHNRAKKKLKKNTEELFDIVT